jgi:hypothetical protein
VSRNRCPPSQIGCREAHLFLNKLPAPLWKAELFQGKKPVNDPLLPTAIAYLKFFGELPSFSSLNKWFVS